MNIPVFALVDTNSDPKSVDYVIPANDDASKSIEKVIGFLIDSIANGLSNRKTAKDKTEAAVESAPKAEAPKAEAPKAEAPKAEAPKAKAKKVEAVAAPEAKEEK